MNEYHKISEGILGEETIEKTNTELFLSLVGQYFPEAIKDGEVDFTALKEGMGEFHEVGSEHYDFTWAGKQSSKKEAQSDIFGKTLKYKPQDSLNPDTTENIYIEGDNLEALKLLRRNYHGKIKMIYIDPPYNTDNDFVYHDNFTMTDEELTELSGDIENGIRLQKNPKSNAKYHTNWLNMMYPRLKLAKDLLSDDGAIFIHIDENEITNMQIICREIFGEQNELGTIIWDKRNPKGSVVGVAYQHESIVVFCKNKNVFANTRFSKIKENANNMIQVVEQLIRKHNGVTPEVKNQFKDWIKRHKTELSGGESAYSLIDKDGRLYQPVSMAAPDKPETRSHRPLIHPVTNQPCPVPEKGWRFTDAKMDELLEKNKIEFGSDETTQPRQKYYLDENMEEAVSSIIYFGGNGDTLGVPFDNPKPIYIAKKIINSLCKGQDDIVLDFFSGSATTAHAVMQLNAEDDGNRKFIMVQLQEICSENTEAYKAGYKNICEIGKERIRRAAKKIHDDNPEAKFDDGFKVFEVADTNIRWNTTDDEEIISLADVDYSTGNKDNIDFTPGHNDIDIVYEIMLRQFDIPLSTPIEKLPEVSDRTYIFANAVVVCLEPEIDEKLIEKLASIEPVPGKFVLRDSAFNDDIELKDVSRRRLSALIANHQLEGERKNRRNNYTVEFI